MRNKKVSNVGRLPLEEPKTVLRAKARLFVVKVVRCLNPECHYYKSRHRRYFWISKTKLAKPSCPKCFSHNTEIVSTQEFE